MGQVDGDGFGPGVGVAANIHDIVNVQISIGPWGFGFVFRRDWEILLQLGQEGGISGQTLTPLLVLYQNEGLMAGFVSEELVFVGFDGPHDYVDTVVLHLHPGKVTGLVFIGSESFSPKSQVPLQPRILSQLRCSLEEIGSPVHGFCESFTIGNRHQGPRLVSTNQGVEAFQSGPTIRGLGNGRLELLHRQVFRVETGTSRLLADTRHKGCVTVDSVPGPVVEDSVLGHIRPVQ